MKYFVCSDIHSFFDEWMEALENAGYDSDNPDHMLIVCGDIFDRGYGTIETYNFLQFIPKERRIMIKGNHEELYLNLLKKPFPDDYDFSNGTVDTFLQISQIDSEHWYKEWLNAFTIEESTKIWRKVVNKVRPSEITKWLKSDEWIDYYELDKYIFVHSFIPTRIQKQYKEAFKLSNYAPSQLHPMYLEPVKNWRERATKFDWSESRWVCPWQMFINGLFDKEKEAGKILVCGHWHASDFHKVFEGEKDNFDIYQGENLIAIDACTAHSHKVNILVLDID